MALTLNRGANNRDVFKIELKSSKWYLAYFYISDIRKINFPLFVRLIYGPTLAMIARNFNINLSGNQISQQRLGLT